MSSLNYPADSSIGNDPVSDHSNQRASDGNLERSLDNLDGVGWDDSPTRSQSYEKVGMSNQFGGVDIPVVRRKNYPNKFLTTPRRGSGAE